MKGLLLKDWYMMKHYCRYYLFCAIGFTILSVMSSGNMFFVFYPCLLCGMIPVNLIGYDERSRWEQYSAALPYTKEQLVSGKYLIGLFAQLAMILVMGVTQAAKMAIAGEFALGEFGVLMLLLLIVSTLTSSISLPFIFKLGVEKGRTAYYVMIGFVCGASALVSNLFGSQSGMEMRPNLLLALLAAAGIGIYIFSWYMSIVFYKRREIS